MENYIYNSLYANIDNSSRLYDRGIFYFSGKSGNECDFILSPNSDPACIQSCWELTHDNQDREIKGLLEAMDFFNQENGYILTYDSEDLILTAGKSIKVIPAWKYFDKEII